MKKYICASILSLLSVTGVSAFATEEILTSPNEEMTSTDMETQAIRQVTYRSQVVRARRISQTWSFTLPEGIRADEIEVQSVRGAVQVQRAVVVFANGNSRSLNTLTGVYGAGRVGIRSRNATFNNVRNVEELLLTVRGTGDRWSEDSFRVVMGLSRNAREDRPGRDDRFEEGIRIISATYGRNVGAPRNNALDEMSAACDGRQTCSFLIDFRALGGDPAPGQPKDFNYSFSCDGQVRAANALVAAEAHMQTVRLSCRN